VAGGPPGELPAPQKVVPPRAARELTIQEAEIPADLATKTPAQVVQAVNQATGKAGIALAARGLPSRDIILTFSDPATKQ
jgi:hypothetical protein